MWTLIQKQYQGTDADSLEASSSVTKGDLLVFIMITDGSGQPSAISDSLNTSWSLINGGGFSSYQIWGYWGVAPSSGSDTVSFSISTGTISASFFSEWEPPAGTTPVLDANPDVIIVGYSQNPLVMTATANYGDELAIGWDDSGDNASTCNSPWVFTLEGENPQFLFDYSAYQLDVSAGTVTFEVTPSIDAYQVGFLATFQAKSLGPQAENWSPVDSRDYGQFPNKGIVQSDGSVDYSAPGSQVSSNPNLPPVDSRAAGAPVNSRVSSPVNSRNAPPF